MKWEKLSNKKQATFLGKWIKNIAWTETDISIKRHMVKHAREIFKSDLNKWSASMKNLIEIFDVMYKVRSMPSIRLERLYKKYKENSKRYTPPPKI